jgi:hypothetical protein
MHSAKHTDGTRVEERKETRGAHQGIYEGVYLLQNSFCALAVAGKDSSGEAVGSVVHHGHCLFVGAYLSK